MQIEENKLIDSIDKQKDIQITAKQNITRFKTEGLQEDRIAAEQNKINKAEKKVKEITKELKKLQKDAKKIESKVKPQLDVLNKLAEDVTNRQQYLKDRHSELQDKISGFAQEQNEYNATDRLLRHTQNNYDIAKNTLKGINSRKLNMMHDIRMQRLATMQSEYMRRFAAKYVGIQNAVLKDNYEDVLYAKINHTNLSQYLDYRAFIIGSGKKLEL